MAEDPASALQRLYQSEINFALSTFWDCGFRWWLGDGLNGYVDAGEAESFADAVDGIVRAAIRHYPDSDFARTAKAA